MAEGRRRKSFDVSTIEVEDFLEQLQVRNVRVYEQEANFSCPFPGHSAGDQHPSAYMNLETTAWNCKGCKRKGNAVSFLADLYNVSTLQAIDWLKEMWGGKFREPDQNFAREIDEYFIQEGKPTIEPVQTLAMEVADKFIVNWEDVQILYDEGKADEREAYMLKRGFDWETLEWFGLGYDPIGDRITIPIHDHLGRLVGFKGRAWDPDRVPKYLVLGDRPSKAPYGFATYDVSRVVPFLDRAKDDQSSALVLTEGELDAIALHQHGILNACALGSSNFSDEHAKLIKRYADEVIIFFDSDPAGYAGAIKIADKLEGIMPVRIVPDHQGDPADMTYEDIIGCLDEAQSAVAIRLGLC